MAAGQPLSGPSLPAHVPAACSVPMGSWALGEMGQAGHPPPMLLGPRPQAASASVARSWSHQLKLTTERLTYIPLVSEQW